MTVSTHTTRTRGISCDGELKERVAAGSLFSSYKRLRTLGFDHRTVNHSNAEYVRLDRDLVSVTTNGVEGFWGNFKVALRSRRGTRRHNLEQFARIRSWRTLGENIFAVVACLTLGMSALCLLFGQLCSKVLLATFQKTLLSYT